MKYGAGLPKFGVTLVLCVAVLCAGAWGQKGDSNTRSVAGQVVDKAGNPLPKSVVYLKNTKTLQIFTYIADEGGAFHFQRLNSNIDYQLHAEHQGTSSPVRTISSFDSRKEIQVTLKIPK